MIYIHGDTDVSEFEPTIPDEEVPVRDHALAVRVSEFKSEKELKRMHTKHEWFKNAKRNVKRAERRFGKQICKEMM